MLMYIIYIIGVVVSLLLNLLVVVVLTKKGKKINHLDLVMVSLAVSDILQASIGYPLEIDSVYKENIISEKACIIAGFSITFFALVSIIHLVLMSIQKSIILRNPLKARLWLKKPLMSLYIIIPSWLYGFLWSLFPLLGWSSYERERFSRHRCSIDLTNPATHAQSYAYCLLIFCFILSLLGIIVSSIFSVKAMKLMTQTGRQLSISNRALGTRKLLENKQTLMTFMLVIVFLTAWSPYAFCVIAMTAHIELGGTVLDISALFAKSSTLYNPLIYLVFLKDFRQKCLVLFRRQKEEMDFRTASVKTNQTVADSDELMENFKTSSVKTSQRIADRDELMKDSKTASVGTNQTLIRETAL